MRTIGFPILVVLTALVFLCGVSLAQYAPTTIEDITTNPKKYSAGAVEVVGTATIYAPAATASTGYYLLKSEKGAAIRVNTTGGPPEMKKRYRITGVVYLDPTTKVPFISEKERVWADAPAPAEVQATEESAGSSWWESPAVVLLLLLVIFAPVVFYIQLRRRASLDSVDSIAEEKPAVVTPDGTYTPPSDLKTVRIMAPSPMTMRYVPGELVLLSGEDRGKSFKIAGFPTPEGSVVTMGREPVTGERAYAHIQIDEKFHTVSRKQAELVWKDRKLYVKNLSDTNPTQVNGVEVKSGKPVHLKPGSIVRAGELEFEYKV
jgi:hypothetical protein